MPKAIVLSELTPLEFLTVLEPLAAVYASAMNAERWTLPGRRDLMRQHACYPFFRAIVARRPRRGALRETIVGFAYGFHGCAGQWWYDSVSSALIAGQDPRPARAWLADCMEVAEVHVHPRHQAHGIGTRMLATLTGGRPEPAALLSTPDRETPARHLYRRLGFADLLTGYRFPGGSPPYAIMGAPLPLPGIAAAPGTTPRSASPSIW